MSDTYTKVQRTVHEIYETFTKYALPADADFCAFCYSDEELSELQSTPFGQIEGDLARRIAWETGDHWSSTDHYKHYLPRIVEVLSPPDEQRDLYPGHLFETLAFHRFLAWPTEERASIWRWIDAVEDVPNVLSTQNNRDGWVTARNLLGPSTRELTD